MTSSSKAADLDIPLKDWKTDSLSDILPFIYLYFPSLNVILVYYPTLRRAVWALASNHRGLAVRPNAVKIYNVSLLHSILPETDTVLRVSQSGSR